MTPSSSENSPQSHTYDVALSFAGEQREYVNRVAVALKALGVPVFYDGFEEENLWGKNLYDYLHEIYSARAKYTVVFISRDYANKLWTSHERKSAQERAFRESREYILPARFDDTSIPGLGETTAYIDCTKRTPEQFAELVAKKLGRSIPTHPLPPSSAPHLHFRDFSFSHSTLLGLLIHGGARAWCVATNNATPSNAIKISHNVAILPNEGEAFKKKQKLGIDALSKAMIPLMALADLISCPIHLHTPLILSDSTYDRFVKTDRRYILQTREALQPFRTPVPTNPEAHVSLLSEEGGTFYAYAAPADYLRDAFGLELYHDGKHEDSVLLRESTFLRNAKFMAIDARSSRVLAFAGIDGSLELSATADSRGDVVGRIQQAITTERRPIQLRAGTHVVETEEQRAKRDAKVETRCHLCLDTKEMVVSHNLRLYRVPCPDCNRSKNRSWMAFSGALQDARRK